MNETVLEGHGRRIVHIPRKHWEAQLAHVPERMKVRLSFMTPEHHRVRYFVVRELSRRATPIPAERISAALKLPLLRVNKILDELEQRLFFLVRDEGRRVSWAFPVTADKTPHRLLFDSEETVYAA